MTGRAAGFCAGYDTPGFMNPIARGMGMRAGRGLSGGRMGWRNRFYSYRGMGYGPGFDPYPPVPYTDEKEELTFLKNQAEAFSARLQEIQKRVEQLSKKKE